MIGRPLATISTRDLQVRYGSIPALSIDKLDISGNVIALVGHNGSGKSTFLKSLLGLVNSSTGKLQASIDGAFLIPEQDMAFSPETGSIFSDISVEDYLKLWCRLKRKRSNFYFEAGREIIESLSITELLGKLGRELSKGQKRRVQIAACLLMEPKLQVFDEPFDGLDIQQAASLADTITSHLDNTSILISSHRMDIVERLADSIIMLERGAVIASGATAEIPLKLGCKGFSINRAAIDHSLDRQLLLHFGQRFPKAVTHILGGQVKLAGVELTLEKIEISLQSLNLSNYEVCEYTPSLADAVHVRQKML